MKKLRMKKIAILLAFTLFVQLIPCYKETSVALAKDSQKSSQTTSQKMIAPLVEFDRTTPSVGKVKALVFKVAFKDVKYGSDSFSAKELKQSIFGQEDTSSEFYPLESVSAYYNRASYGKLKIDGDVYAYTAEHKRSYYSNEEEYETLTMEILDYYDSKIDYSKYDGNQDDFIDCLSIGVPLDGTAGDAFWYGCQATWYLNSDYFIDGVKVKDYIINDEQPFDNNVSVYNATLAHEMGHSMGLPDYYKYNSENDWEGLKGIAGYERMDDSVGDFSSFSKLMNGWLTTKQIQVADLSKNSSTYSIKSASDAGSCLIVPIGKLDSKYFSEYFLIEYLTPTQNNYGIFNESGIRILHVAASTITNIYDSRYQSFQYENYSPAYDTSNNGKRILQLVNDNGGFYTEGSIIKYGVTNFGIYNSKGSASINPGFEIKVGKLNLGSYEVTINKSKSKSK